MQRLAAILLFISVVACSCSEQETTASKKTDSDSTQNKTFFPVTEFIRGQLRETDSLPITPLKIITYNGKQDSVWMKKEDIRPFAQPFLSPEIDTTNLKHLFTEKSFLDQTINAFTFSYDPIDKLPDTLQLKRWDVYIDPKKGEVKRIYIIKQTINNGNVQTLQLTWKTNQWCKISTITEHPGKQTEIKEELMKWDFSD